MKHPLEHIPQWESLVTFDIVPGTKRPSVSAWQALPEGNRSEGKTYGLVCGPGWFVLDVDDHAALDALEAEFGDLPDTLTVHSAPQSGGMHLYFLGDAATGSGTPRKGLDIRGQGKGYVLGPGSDYPGNPKKGIPSGGEYTIGPSTAQVMAQAPAWLLAACSTAITRPTTDATGIPKTAEDLRDVSKGKSSKYAMFWREVCTGMKPASLPDDGWNDYLTRATLWLSAQSDWCEVLGATVVEIMRPSLSLMHQFRLERGQDLEHLTEESLAGLYDRGATKSRTERQAREIASRAIETAKADTTSGPRVLQHRSAFYIAHDRLAFYGPLHEKEVWGAVRDLPLAAPRTMEIQKPTKTGMMALSPRELFEIYGRGGHLAAVEQSLSARVATMSQGVLVMPSTNPPDIPPEYSPAIDHWLGLIGGDAVRDWIAVSMDLDEACPALWFTGIPGVGKSLIVKGLAGLWGKSGAIPMVNAFGQFNKAMAACPVVEGQEAIPADGRGNPRLEDLKALISDTSRWVEPKGFALNELTGAVRVILSSNNIAMLRGKRDITTEDADALLARFIHIRIDDPAARDYLNGMAVQRDWINSGALTRHFMWLIQNRQPERGPRFRLPPLSNGLDEALRTGPGGGFFVLRACYDWILRAAQAVSEGSPLTTDRRMCWVSGTLRCSAIGIKAKLESDRRSMNDRTLGEAIRRVSSGKRSTRMPDGKTAKMWVIRTAHIAHWADTEGWGSVEELDEAIKILDSPNEAS